jgi:hypothetical protein
MDIVFEKDLMRDDVAVYVDSFRSVGAHKVPAVVAWSVSVQRVPSGSREILRQKRVDIFVGPTGSDALECLGEPSVGVDVVEARGRKQ